MPQYAWLAFTRSCTAPGHAGFQSSGRVLMLHVMPKTLFTRPFFLSCIRFMLTDMPRVNAACHAKNGVHTNINSFLSCIRFMLRVNAACHTKNGVHTSINSFLSCIRFMLRVNAACHAKNGVHTIILSYHASVSCCVLMLHVMPKMVFTRSFFLIMHPFHADWRTSSSCEWALKLNKQNNI